MKEFLKSFNRKHIITTMVMMICAAVLTLTAFRPEPKPGKDLFEIKKNLDIFYDVYSSVEGMYVDEPQPGTLMKTGIDAMLRSLDPYTVYIPESKIEDYRFMTTGAYGGIGAMISTRDNRIIITESYEDQPAHKAGLRAGDEIIAVDGKSTIGKEHSDINEIIKGQPDTELEITYKRYGVSEPIKTKIIRENIKVPDVPYAEMVDENTGYVKLNAFTQSAFQEVKASYDDLAERGMKQFVLDLRGNGGGLLVEAVRIVNMFVEKGSPVVTMKGRIDNTNKVYDAREKPVDTDIPVVILVDENSASASEIVSGSLQDLDRAVIVGTRTYGKGLVQQTHDLKYNSKIKITIAKYYIPSGRCIQKVDYFHRVNGKAADVPDSLISEFKTANGRIVHDGSGVNPDIKVDPEEFSNLTRVLVTNHIVFDFATQYRWTHDSIPSPENFHLKESDFEEFKKFALSKDFEYTNESVKQLAELKRIAAEEKYMQDVDDSFRKLETILTPNKNTDLDRYKEQLVKIIESEIISRYYFQDGRAEHALKHDNFLKEAINILNSRSEYNKVLGRP